MTHPGTLTVSKDFLVTHGFRVVAVHADGKCPSLRPVRAMQPPQLRHRSRRPAGDLCPRPGGAGFVETGRKPVGANPRSLRQVETISVSSSFLKPPFGKGNCNQPERIEVFERQGYEQFCRALEILSRQQMRHHDPAADARLFVQWLDVPVDQRQRQSPLIDADPGATAGFAGMKRKIPAGSLLARRSPRTRDFFSSRFIASAKPCSTGRNKRVHTANRRADSRRCVPDICAILPE